MRAHTLKTLLAVTALALGLAGQAAAQTSSEVRRPQPRPQAAPKQPAGSVKVTETPAETAPAEQPAAAAQTAQSTPPPGMGTAQGSATREETAISVARDWLATVDSGNYSASYDQAGDLFRGTTPREQWQAGLEGSRRNVGPLAERNLKSALVTKDLPNAPQGKYVVTTFETRFQAPQPVWEILTTFLNPSGQWKVVGYQIKPQDAAGQKPPQK